VVGVLFDPPQRASAMTTVATSANVAWRIDVGQRGERVIGA
jgi:hypothetical protein